MSIENLKTYGTCVVFLLSLMERGFAVQIAGLWGATMAITKKTSSYRSAHAHTRDFDWIVALACIASMAAARSIMTIIGLNP